MLEDTYPDTSSEKETSRAAPPLTVVLVLAWSFDEPQRIGDIAVPPPGSPGDEVVWGRRGEARGAGRLLFQRQRPGRILPTGEVSSIKVSRNQLRLRSLSPDILEVTNIGRATVLHNGVEATSFRAVPGDVIEIGHQVTLLCVQRRAWIEWPMQIDEFPYGNADPHGIVGESTSIWELRRRIAFVASQTGHVLVRGESGTGKELVARALHLTSERASRGLVARNAATLPEGLLDAELFGNIKNYPNPGTPERAGLVGEADGSTLFLDEIGEISQVAQAHLLRVLDCGEYHRLGESKARTSHLRLIGATNRPESALKHDLAARFVFRIEVPNLNDRRQDIPLLIMYLLRQIAKRDASLANRFFEGETPKLSMTFVRFLLRHTYTTNVRELSILLWQALSESPGHKIVAPAGFGKRTLETTGEFPEPVGLEPPAPVELPAGLSAEAIQTCLDAHNGIIEDAWRPLGLTSRHALSRLIKKYGLQIRRNVR